VLEVTFIGAGFAGLLSFLSPCILPIVPFYLSYLAGVGMNQITADAEIDAQVRNRRSSLQLQGLRLWAKGQGFCLCMALA